MVAYYWPAERTCLVGGNPRTILRVGPLEGIVVRQVIFVGDNIFLLGP